MAWERVPVYSSHRSEDRTLKISKLYSTMQGKHTRKQGGKKKKKKKKPKKKPPPKTVDSTILACHVFLV